LLPSKRKYTFALMLTYSIYNFSNPANPAVRFSPRRPRRASALN